jgi:3-deoxy-D-manno-octulosonic-acid transferase
VFLGGSLAKIGGHNPIEPANYGCSVVTGPHTFNNQSIYTELVSNHPKAIWRIQTKDELTTAINTLLTDPSYKEMHKSSLSEAKQMIAKNTLMSIQNELKIVMDAITTEVITSIESYCA